VLKTAIALVVVCLSFALVLNGCCNSLMCNARKVASSQLSCEENLAVTNVTKQVNPGLQSEDRYLRVDGCGKQTQVACEPTNLKKQVKKYKEDVIVPQNRLGLKWKCRPHSELAQK
jgi:hypothetical protein